MKSFIAIMTLFLIARYSHGQPNDSTQLKYETRNIIGLTPVKKNVKINGLAVGFMGKPWRGAESLKINGLNIDTAPFALFGGVLAFSGTFLAPFNGLEKIEGQRDELGFADVFPDSIVAAPETDIKGLSVSTGLLRNSQLRGTGINVFVSFSDRTNGLEVTGIMNLHYSFSGVMIAGLRNKTTTGRGVQIGLINTCKSGRVVQFGLINRVGKRVLPIINFSLKKSRSTR